MDTEHFKVRKRNPKACSRCHRRKQRCVGYPICTNCKAANSSCTRSKTSSFQPASERYHGMSKDALFDRIEELEAQLKAGSKPSQTKAPGHPYQSPDQFSFDQSPDVGHLFDVMEYLTTGQMSGQTPLSSSSPTGTLIAEMDQIFEDTVLGNSRAETTDMEHESESSNDIRPPAPTDTEGLKYIRIYMETMHNHMPYLDSGEIYRTHKERLHPFEPTRSARWKFSKLFMVYAIGAATSRVTETSQPSITANDLFRTALRLKPSVTELRSLQSIEAMMLLIMYNLRIPDSSNIWYMIGVAMRTAIDLGLHREDNYLGLKPDEAQSRRCVFWSIYVMDRSIARLLDRPFNIAEHDIDVGLPFDYQEPYQSYPDELPIPEETDLKTSISAFIPVIRLTRLKSQIQNRVHRVDKEVSLLIPEINPLFSALKEYKQSLQSDLSPIDHDWINMHWNNGIGGLIQPFLRVLPSDHELIRTCMRASGQTCQAFKTLHQRGYIGFGYFLVSTLFKAGLTLCYCLFRSSQPCSIDVANDLGACSSVLFAIAERNNQLKKYRDTWESILAKVMEHLEQVSSSYESRHSIIPQLNPPNPFASLSIDTHGAVSGFNYANLASLNHLETARGQKHQEFWAISPRDGLSIEESPASNSQELLSALEGLYPAWQEDMTPQRRLENVFEPDEMISESILEERRSELRVIGELFGNPE